MHMATDPNIHRIIPVQGGEVARRRLEDHGGTGANQMQAGEVHTSTDTLGFARIFCAHKHVGGYLHHGDIASEAAMLALDNPGIAHACLPGDTCRRTDLAGSPIYECISGRGTLAANWQMLGGSVAWGAVTGTLADQLDLTAALAAKSDSDHTHTAAEVAVTPSGTVTAGTVQGAITELAAQELSDSGSGDTLIAGAPFGLKKLLAGAGIALTVSATAITISATETGSGAAPNECGTTFAGLSVGDIAADASGYGWIGNATPYVADHPNCWDVFTGVPLGAITSWAGGTGWLGDATPYTP